MKMRSLLFAALLIVSTPAVALAQTQGGPGQPPPGSGNAAGGAAGAGVVDRNRERSEESATQDRSARDRRRNRRERETSAEEALANARVAAVAAGLNCGVTAAKELGRTEVATAFEIVCDNGVGYILSPTEPPQPINCLAQNTNTAQILREDPTVEGQITCEMPANLNAIAQVKPWADAAGITCRIDEATWVGRMSGNRDRFEIGCAGLGGAWVEVGMAGENPTMLDCFQIISSGKQCTLTTGAEQGATLRARLQGTTAPDCAITDARFMGSNANGAFYEAACDGAEGFVARFDAAGAFQQTYPCSEAGSIGDGCRLSAAVPADQPVPVPQA